ncbi:MAG: NAD(P)H-hydrate dehydratase, partial [Pseudomonadota bacterium]
ARQIFIVCGTGNNGGDGLVMARLLRQAGLQVSVAMIGDVGKITGAAEQALQDYREAGGELGTLDSLVASNPDVVVDALFGSGLKRNVEGAYAEAVEVMNNSGIPILSVDVPSGVCSSRGCTLSAAVHADVTITFVGEKRGLLTGIGPDHCGTLIHDPLLSGYRSTFQPSGETVRAVTSASDLEIIKRPLGFHKGRAGRLLCVGGNVGFSGALTLCAQAGSRAGEGLVTALGHPKNSQHSEAPEVMTLSSPSPEGVSFDSAAFAVIAVGPGLGVDAWARDWFDFALNSQRPLLVDADALNLLAMSPREFNCPCVLTPHPAEAARLLDQTTDAVQSNRFEAVRSLANKYRATVILKGNGTLVDDGRSTTLIRAGNPGMASGGMGDVLAGVVAALLGQGYEPYDAACLGAVLHANAGDDAYRRHGYGMNASDVSSGVASQLAGALI